MESDQDFLTKYWKMLENEKRRLNIENFNLTENDEAAIPESQATTECINQNMDTILQPNKESPEKSTNDLSNKEIVPIVPKNTPYAKSSNEQRADTMEQWVTDSFYTSFPSYKKQDLAKNTLADDRREDYKKYLAEISNKKLLDGAKNSRRIEELIDANTVSKATDKQTFSPRNKLLDDLKHSNFSNNFHNPDAIQERNQNVAIERTRRKTELQQELIKQIEEKKLEIEKLRAKEKEEHERLERRLQSQIRSLQMADEINKRNAEKVLVVNPINKATVYEEAVLRRELENNANTHKSPEKSKENGIQYVKANSDREIYKFFSNSAPHNDYNVNYYNQQSICHNSIPFNGPEVHRVYTTNNLTQQCNHCRRFVPQCGSCCRDNSYYCCYRCNILQNIDVCNNCRRVWVQSWNHRGGAHVEHCAINNYPRDSRPQILEITYQDHKSQTRALSPYNYKADIKSTHNDHNDINANASNQRIINDNHSSTNFDKNTSMESNLSNVPEVIDQADNFSLSKDVDILELKRKSDILIAKHARNYGSLRNRKSISNEIETKQKYSDDSFPLPLMREHITTTASRNAGTDKSRQNSQTHRKLEYKWEIPVVQKQVITNNPSKVLTQVGAIARQLQLEKLNFGN